MNIRARISDSWLPPDRRPIYEWAADNVWLSQSYTIQGRFNVHLSRYLVEPFAALQNDLVREVVMVAPVRSGKSMIADVWMPWIVANDPGPSMWCLQTDPVAKRHAETRTMPMLRMCEAVQPFMPEDRHKLRTQEVIFRHGMPLYVQGPSLGNLQTVGVRYMIVDELWMWEPGRFGQATARLGDYEKIQNSKLLVISQAGVKDDELDQEFRRGDQREWQVPCLRCGAFMPAVFSGRRPDGTRWGMRWDDGDGTRDKLGHWNLAAVLPTVRWECRDCGHPHLGDSRTTAEWNRQGKYVASNSKAPPSIQSFHVSSIVTREWRALVEEFLEAQNALKVGIVEPLMLFTQKRDAMPWSEDLTSRDDQAQTVAIQSDWPDEVARFLTVDRQAEGLHWATIRQWAKTGESRRLWFGKLYSEDEIIGKALEHKVPSNRVLIDSGFDSKLVYGMCVRNGWIALKGDERANFQHMLKSRGRMIPVLRSYAQPVQADPEIGTTHEGRRYARLIRWSNPTIKDRLQRIIERGLWKEPPPDEADEMDKEYRRQMRGQWRKPIRDPKTGRTRWAWVDNGNDHARDCACMQVLGATLLRLLPDMQPHEEGGDA